jgi:pimeloyl-ACP methyl ester carboxylesterase
MLDGVVRRRMSLPESGVEIALLDWGGNGPLAVLHHANGFCAALWDPVARALRSEFRVIAMDARGHGDSSKPEGDHHYRWEAFGRDLAAVASALAAEQGVARVALGLGHSFGGTSMLMAAAERRDLFERLVLADPVIRPPVGDSSRTVRAHELTEGARARRRVFESRDAAREAWRRKPLFAQWRSESFDLYLEEGLEDRDDGQVELKCPPAAEAAVFANGRHFDLWSVAARVTTPTRLLWAAQGDFPHFLFAEMEKHMAPHAELMEVDAGHLMLMERPECVVDAVRSFAPPRHALVSAPR